MVLKLDGCPDVVTDVDGPEVPEELSVPCVCPGCDKTHWAVYEKNGEALHDDGPRAVYTFVGIRE